MTYPNLWDAMKAVLRRKLIALSASKKKLERAYTRKLTTQLKALEQKEKDTPKRIRPNRNRKNHSKNQQNQEVVL